MKALDEMTAYLRVGGTTESMMLIAVKLDS